MTLYPLKFKTLFKDKIWGGQKIKTILGKDSSPLPNCGETWELSGVGGNISEVSNGPLHGKLLTKVIEEQKGSLLGERVLKTYGEEFPLLIKFIDAADDLSIQVHPDNELAKKRHNSFGKTEMWYIMQADEGSTLISGFNQELDKTAYQKAFDEGRLNDILNREVAEAGDVFFLPAGRVHTIGKGLLLAEIQQTSDVTYRIYDFDRKDAEGNLRELHLEESLDAIDYKKYDHYKTPYTPQKDESVELAKCEYFVTNRLDLTSPKEINHSGLDCFKIYICLSGEASLNYEGGSESLKMGDVILVPASMEKYQIETSTGANLLESYIPQ
ncbi:MAG: class I mannose-6-phosphate isomerase [Cyclobacteriaceae bacterium]